jgi:hypothetical protein
VIVEPPSTTSPALTFFSRARAMPSTSSPSCWKKRRSSIAIVDLGIHALICLYGTGWRFFSAGITPSRELSAA